MSEFMIPISMFAMILGIIWVVSTSKAKSKVEIQRTIQAAISNNTELTPEVIKALGANPAKPFADLRAGVVLIAVALGFMMLGVGISNADHNEEVMSIMMGVAAFPGFIGLALVAMHFFLKGKEDSAE